MLACCNDVSEAISDIRNCKDLRHQVRDQLRGGVHGVLEEVDYHRVEAVLQGRESPERLLNGYQ